MTDQIKKTADGSNRFFNIHPPVFWPAVFLLVVFIVVTLAVGEPMKTVFSVMQSEISDNFGWFLLIAVNFYLFFMLYLAFSKYGSIRLGGRNAVPDFGRLSWFAMLFSAGMGIGILFWSVAEPLYHFTEPVLSRAETVPAAREAMQITFLHWGLHPWGIYALVGMALAFFTFNRHLPLAIRSVFYPLLGDRVYGFWGDAIDVLAVLSTLFGLATSLGFGVQQVSAGIHHLFGLPDTLTLQIILMAGITFIATLSVFSGLDQGVKRLSELNLNMGAVLLFFVILAGPSVFILDSFVQNMGSYLNDFFSISFWAESYQHTGWQNKWTLFYWSWWVAWSPFVGMFIARISRGRTIREFVLSVLIIPTLLTFLWITAFGGSAIHFELNAVGNIAEAARQNVAISIYELLGNLPLSIITNTVAVLLVVSFFVTSADSGSLVIDAFTSGGELISPVPQRIFWAFMIGAVAAVLLLGGGLDALQTASITTGLPFAVILVFMAFSLRKGLQTEHEADLARRKAVERESYQKLVSQMLKGDSQESDDGSPPSEK